MTAPPVAALLDLTGRVAVVTGAAGGIGAGIARRFAEAGASIVVHHRGGAAGAEALADELGGMAVGADLLEAGAAESVAAAAVDRFGRLDVWVNNAGVQPVRALLDTSDADLAAVLDGNLTVTLRATRAAAAMMDPGSSIVDVASIEGLQPARGHAHYTAAKAGIIAHARAAALELGGRGVRVNAVAPGLIDREGLADDWPVGVERWLAACPLGRLGTPADVADACLFLASPAARWISGAVLVVDGGVLSASTW